MPNESGTQHHMATRASNREAHPGNVVKSKTRRTTAEVQQERAAKEQTKAAHEEAKRQNINRAANFEYTDLANEDMADVTPRPPQTPKQWLPSGYCQNANISPLTGMSEEDESDGDNMAFFERPVSEITSDNGQDRVSNSDFSPPVQKWKAGVKAMAQQFHPVAMQKRKQVFEGTAPPPEEVQSQPQPKKVKKEVVKVRDVINAAVNKLEVNKTQKYGDMVRSTLNERTGGGEQGGPALRPPSQDKAKGRPL